MTENNAVHTEIIGNHKITKINRSCNEWADLIHCIMFLSNGKIVSRDNKHSIHKVPFSYCENLVEPLKIHAVHVRILYKIGNTEEYYNIALSQQGQKN